MPTAIDRRRDIVILELGNTKIENLDRIAAALIGFEPDVVGLKITVNDALQMCLVNRRANLFKNIKGPRHREIFLFIEYLAERTAVEVLHYEIGDLSVIRFGKAKVGNVNDVWMSQTSGRTSFAAKSLDKLRPLHELRSNYLHRHRPFGAKMGRQIHRPHPAPSEFARHLVLPVQRLSCEIKIGHFSN